MSCPKAWRDKQDFNNLWTLNVKSALMQCDVTDRMVLSSAAERICLSLLHHRAFLMADVWPEISWCAEGHRNDNVLKIQPWTRSFQQWNEYIMNEWRSISMYPVGWVVYQFIQNTGVYLFYDMNVSHTPIILFILATFYKNNNHMFIFYHLSLLNFPIHIPVCGSLRSNMRSSLSFPPVRRQLLSCGDRSSDRTNL